MIKRIKKLSLTVLKIKKYINKLFNKKEMSLLKFRKNITFYYLNFKRVKKNNKNQIYYYKILRMIMINIKKINSKMQSIFQMLVFYRINQKKLYI